VVPMATQEDNLLDLIKKSPGLDIYTITSKLSVDIVHTKKTLNTLEADNKVISGLQKGKGNSTGFVRVYYCSPSI
jgi:hypothetical protein